MPPPPFFPAIGQARQQAKSFVATVNMREQRTRTTVKDIVGYDDDPLGLLTTRARVQRPERPGAAAGAKPPSASHLNRSSNFSPGSSTSRPARKNGGAGKPEPAARTEKRAGGSTRLSPVDFAAPVARRGRPATSDGRTSFHFSVTSVSRTARPIAMTTGTVARSGSPAAHDAYLIRDAALAVIERDEITITAAPASGNAGRDPGRDITTAWERQERWSADDAAGLTGEERTDVLAAVARFQAEAMAAAADESINFREVGKGLADLGFIGDVTPEMMGLHLPGDFKPGVFPARVGRPRHDSAAGHDRYLERPAAIARLPDGEPAMYTNMPRNTDERQDLWDRIERSERLPGADTLALASPASGPFWRSVAIHPDCPDELRDGLQKAGSSNAPRLKLKDGQRVMKWLTGQPHWDIIAPLVTLSPGRGGTVQHRMIIELPVEVDNLARARIIRGLAEQFERRGLPYIAVMHAPDYTSDDRNWHCHLAYYERPVNRMADGRYDFEIAEKVSGRTDGRVHYPHRQLKGRDVHRPEWVKSMRQLVADLSNRELEAAGAPRRLDPRTYEKMGIEREPMAHLGTKAAALEAMGISTPVGDANAQKDWKATIRALERERTDALAEVERTVKLSRTLGPPQTRTMMSVWQEMWQDSIEYRYFAGTVEAVANRSRSRPEQIIELAGKRLTAIDAGKVKRSEAKERERLNWLRFDAQSHLRKVEAFLAEPLAQAAEWRRQATQLDREARSLRDAEAKAQTAYKIAIEEAARRSAAQLIQPAVASPLPRRAPAAAPIAAVAFPVRAPAIVTPAAAAAIAPATVPVPTPAAAPVIAAIAAQVRAPEESEQELRQRMTRQVINVIKTSPSFARLVRGPDGRRRYALTVVNPDWVDAIDSANNNRNPQLLAELTKAVAEVASVAEASATPTTQPGVVPSPVTRPTAAPTVAPIVAPAVVPAAAQAVRAAPAPARAPNYAPTSTPPRVTAVPVAPAAVPAPAASAAASEDAERMRSYRFAGAVTLLSKNAYRLIESNTGLTLSDEHMKKLRLEPGDFEGAGRQLRLAQIKADQDAEIRSVAAWILKNTSGVNARKEFLEVTARNAPDNVYTAARRWAGDENLVRMGQVAERIETRKAYEARKAEAEAEAAARTAGANVAAAAISPIVAPARVERAPVALVPAAPALTAPSLVEAEPIQPAKLQQRQRLSMAEQIRLRGGPVR